MSQDEREVAAERAKKEEVWNEKLARAWQKIRKSKVARNLFA